MLKSLECRSCYHLSCLKQLHIYMKAFLRCYSHALKFFFLCDVIDIYANYIQNKVVTLTRFYRFRLFYYYTHITHFSIISEFSPQYTFSPNIRCIYFYLLYYLRYIVILISETFDFVAIYDGSLHCCCFKRINTNFVLFVFLSLKCAKDDS